MKFKNNDQTLLALLILIRVLISIPGAGFISNLQMREGCPNWATRLLPDKYINILFVL